MNISRRTFLALLAVSPIAAFGAASSTADDFLWTGNDDNIFHNPDNWQNGGGGLPGAGDNAAFVNTNAPFAFGGIVFTENAASNLLTVTFGSNVGFDLGTFTYAVSILDVSFNTTLALQNGTLTAASALVHGGGGAASTLTVGNGGNFEVGMGGLIIGNVGGGTLNIQDGGSATAALMQVGLTAVGNSTVNINQGGTLTTGTTTLAVAAGSNATANVNGEWTNNTALTVASAGTAELNIGHDGNASTGTGGSVTTNFLTVGGATGGNGTINIGESATLESTIATLASAANRTALVNIGDGATWTNHGLISAGGAAGANAEINVAGGGLLRTQNLTIGAGATVTAAPTGSIVIGDTNLDIANLPQPIQDLIASGGLFVSNNSLTISGGGVLEASQGFIDSLTSDIIATATVVGADSLLDLGAGDLNIASSGGGSLSIAGGGAVQSGDAFIGTGAGANGSVTVTGDDSLLDAAGDVHVGFDANLNGAASLDAVTGVLNVNTNGAANIGGTLLVNETGLLTGNGSIMGTVNVHGILRPGFAEQAGTLNIIGDLTLNDGSTFLVNFIGQEVEGQPGVMMSGHVDVDGTADVHAGTVVLIVKVGGGPISEGDQLIILNADAINIVEGDIEDISVQQEIQSFIAWTLSKESNGGDFLVLTAEFLEDDLLNIVDTLPPNFGAVVDAALEVPEIRSGLFDLTPEELPRAIQSLMPLQHAGAVTQSIRTAQMFGSGFLGQMGAHRAGLGANGGMASPGMFAGSATDPVSVMKVARYLDRNDDPSIAFGAVEEWPRWGGFVQGFGLWERVDSGTDRTGHRATVAGGFVGLHNHVSPDFLIGITGGYVNTDLNFRDGFGDGEIHTFRGGPYLSWTPGGGDFFIDAAATYGYHRNEINRNVLVPTPGTARGKYDAHDVSALGQVGYDFAPFPQTVITPLLGLEYTHLRTDSFNETGSGANLAVDSQTTNSLRGRAGLKLAHALHIEDHVIIPEIFGGYAHEFLDTDIDLRSRFVAGGPSFTTRAAGVGRGALQVAGGFTAMAGTYLTLYIRYEGEFQSNRTSHGVVGGLNINF